MASWKGDKKSGAHLELPPPLQHVPSKLELITATAGEVPKRLQPLRGSPAEIFWLGRGRFPLPKVQVRIKLSPSKDLAATPSQAALRQVHSELAAYSLTEVMYDFRSCGVSWMLEPTDNGYNIAVSAYAEHMQEVVRTLAEGFKHPHKLPKNQPDAFAHVKQKLLFALRDVSSDPVYKHALHALNTISTSGVFSRNDLIEALQEIDEKKLDQYLKELLGHGFPPTGQAGKPRGLRIQLLVTGNANEKEAQRIGHELTKGLELETPWWGGPALFWGGSRVLLAAESAHNKVLKNARPVEVRLANPIDGDANGAIVNAYQYGIPDISQRVKVGMLGKMIYQPAYDTLRTKEQLGYVVFAYVKQHVNTLELRVVVQGSKKSPDNVNRRIENMLDEFSSSLSRMTLAEFNHWKESARIDLIQEDQNMDQEADRFWSQIIVDDECFDHRKQELEYLKSLQSPDDLVQDFNELRMSMKKLSVRFFGKKDIVSRSGKNYAPPEEDVRPEEGALVLYSDAAADKEQAARGQKFFSAAPGICTTTRHAALEQMFPPSPAAPAGAARLLGPIKSLGFASSLFNLREADGHGHTPGSSSAGTGKAAGGAKDEDAAGGAKEGEAEGGSTVGNLASKISLKAMHTINEMNAKNAVGIVSNALTPMFLGIMDGVSAAMVSGVRWVTGGFTQMLITFFTSMFNAVMEHGLKIRA
eukprot:gnl/TRDRNA2_/TRDRNA2_80385_c0_seq1.p1 gnl/TRDRNA2_/TRDRNA2_80385_c0~~gnl/TRDRNA2_/TRDRNA2_80385_c0_seq1.p1  ORF type:complete len:734 (-),score=167.44 gnl/TRDRNA2_/TRDRNA2_80385_c0_seq1:53-2149(-)